MRMCSSISIREVAAAALRTASPRARALQAPASAIEDVLRAYVFADRYTGNHSVRVANLSLAIAARLRSQDTRFLIQLYAGALLHDIGKTTLTPGLLDKPGRLSQAERTVVESHSAAGARMLENVLPEETILSVVRSHHEHYNGTGYPDGLAGEAIPLGARIVAVADAYDAMLSVRPYRAAMPLAEARRILRDDDNRQWDAGVVQVLYRLSCEGATQPEEEAAGREPLSTPKAPFAGLAY